MRQQCTMTRQNFDVALQILQAMQCPIQSEFGTVGK